MVEAVQLHRTGMFASRPRLRAAFSSLLVVLRLLDHLDRGSPATAVEVLATSRLSAPAEMCDTMSTWRCRLLTICLLLRLL